MNVRLADIGGIQSVISSYASECTVVQCIMIKYISLKIVKKIWILFSMLTNTLVTVSFIGHMFYLSQSEITTVDSNFGVRTSKNFYFVENIVFLIAIFMRFPSVFSQHIYTFKKPTKQSQITEIH